MALQLFVHDNVAGTCELASLLPYPKITTVDPSVTVTPVVDPATGQVDYQLDVDNTVDINVDNFSYDAAAQNITLTETDGTVHTINVTDLLDNVTSVVTQGVTVGNTIAKHDDGTGNVVDIIETITEIGLDGAGFTYKAEDGTETNISFCDMASALPDNGTVVGG